MKRILLTLLAAIFVAAVAFCGVNKTLTAAQGLYKSARTVAQYQAAKKKFQSARTDVGYVAAEHEAAIKSGISKCDVRIKELNGGGDSGGRSSTPYLKVDGSTSSAEANFGASGGYASFSISTNQGTPQVTALPSWISVTSRSSREVEVYCSPNNSTSSRSDWFTISAGSCSVRVNVYQSAGARIEYLDLGFCNAYKGGNQISDVGESLYSEDMRYLYAYIKYNGPSYTQTKNAYIKIIKPDGTLFTGNNSPSGYTWDQACEFKPGTNNWVRLDGWGNASQSVYSPGTYRYEVYIDGSRVLSKNFTIYSRNRTATYLLVDDAKSCNYSLQSYEASYTFEVRTDGSEWRTWGVPSWCEVTKKTSNSFTLKVKANPYSSSRHDYMKVISGSKEVRIDLTQNGR